MLLLFLLVVMKIDYHNSMIRYEKGHASDTDNAATAAAAVDDIEHVLSCSFMLGGSGEGGDGRGC